MIAFFSILLLASFGSLVVQHFIPPLPFLEGARVMLMPLILFYGALALPYGGMLMLALACGLMSDALTGQLLEIVVGHVPTATAEISMGWSVLLYVVLGTVMSGFRPLFQRGRWEVHCLMSGILTSVILLAEFLMLSIRRAALYDAPFVFTKEIGWRIGGAGLMALVLAPILFWMLTTLAAAVGYDPRQVGQGEEAEA